jgi:tetratricopeptide (TPR) repeat protein
MHHLLRHGEPFAPRHEDSLCLFLHIPKCAGSSFNALLRRSHAERFIHLDQPADYERLARLGSGPWFLSGHITWGCHAAVPGNRRTAYVTFLRDPHRTFLSLHHYLWKSGRMQKDLEQYLLTEHQPNHMVRWLGSGSLALAKERLEGLFLHFGLVERMEDSLRLMAPDLDLTLGDMPRVNVSGAARLEFPADLLPAFLETNALDVELYAWAVRLFTERATGLPPVTTLDACDPPAAMRTDWNRSAVEALDSGRYEDALLALEEKTPRHPRDYGLLAQVQERLGRFSRALALYRKVEAAHPQSYALEMSRILLRCGQVEQALATARRHDLFWSRFTPGFPDAHAVGRRLLTRRFLAQSRLALGRRTEALKTALSVVELETVGCRNRLWLAGFLLDCGETAAARRLLETLAAPEDASERGLLHSLTARLLEAEGNGAGALAEHDRALAAAPLSWPVLQNAVTCARRQGEHRRAVEALRAFRRDRRDHELLARVDRELSATLFEAGEVEEAASVFSGIRSDDRLIGPAWGDPRRELSLTRVFVRTGRMLVLRTAPWVHFFAFLQKARPLFHGRMDVLTANPDFLTQRNPDGMGSILAMPSGRFSHAEHAETLAPALFNGMYDAVVVLTSNLDARWYGDIFRLAGDIPAAERLIYSMDQAASERFRSFFLPLPPEREPDNAAPRPAEVLPEERSTRPARSLSAR